MHTPAEIGFWRKPEILAFADQVKHPDAGAWILRLREFVLLEGDDFGRIPRRYQFRQIAAVIQPRCSYPLLQRALVDNGLLRRRRKTWFVPDWDKSTAGRYCAKRRWERERKEELRAAQHAALIEEAENGTGAGQVRDSAGTREGTSRSINKGRPRDRTAGPPGRPPKGGKIGAARWEWFSRNYLKISAPEKCQRLLEWLTADEWEHLQYSVPRQMARYRGGRESKFCPGAVKYLADKRFLEIRMPDRAELERARKTAKGAPGKPTKLTPEQERQQARRNEWAFLKQYLLDNWPDKEKTKRQAEYFKRWGEKPWEKGTVTP